MTAPIFSLRDATITFGIKPVFEHLDAHIYERDRICLVGRNGEGKSTLMKVVSGLYELDAGEKFILPGVVVGYLPQQPIIENAITVYDLVKQSLPKEKQTAEHEFLIDIVLTPLGIEKNWLLSELSGGQLRRASLAASLIAEPNLLLLDEPTNHLDIHTIEWLEQYLKAYRGALIVISHDRAFLREVSNKTFWLDRGALRVNNKGYSAYEEWSIQILEDEQKHLDKLAKKVEYEEGWLHGGISARRKRNQRRLNDLVNARSKLNENKSALRKLSAKFTLDPLSPGQSSKLVTEFNHVSYNYGDKVILDNFSYRIMKGEKIGVVGNNGTGKTTFLKLLVKSMEPLQGTIKHGKTITITYFDQKREHLNPDETLWQTLCPTGGDQVKMGKSSIHVCAYLKRFLFDPKQAQDKVATLSGGQANRLLLARALADPGSFLILDEPTNDLDMDTLDMIQDFLSDYQGTLLLVSHDRDFIDRIVTKTLVFTGSGEIEEFFGGYEEYKNYIKKCTKPEPIKKQLEQVKEIKKKPIRLSYNLQRELELLPNLITKLEQQIAETELALADSSLYTTNPDKFYDLSQDLRNKKEELEYSYTRWQELEAL